MSTAYLLFGGGLPSLTCRSIFTPIGYLLLSQHTPYGHGCIYVYIYPDHTHSFKLINDHELYVMQSASEIPMRVLHCFLNKLPCSGLKR